MRVLPEYSTAGGAGVITEAIIWVFSRLVAFLVGLIPGWSPPTWFFDAQRFLANGLEDVAGYALWMPLPAIGAGIAFMLVCSGIALAIRLGRMLLSVTTGGGGSAA